MEWTTACIDWEERLVQGKSIIPPPIFADQAAEALHVFKQLHIVDAPGSPTFGECCDQWVFDYVAAIFGSYDAETGRRLIRESLLLIPKKNSKSTIAAGIMLTALILSWRVSDELIILAPTKEIALNAFKPVQDMIKFDPRLDALFQVQDHIKTVTHKTKGSTLKVVAADSDTVGGKKASWVLVDEEWLFGKNSRADSMFREAKGGLTSRPEGIFIKLSTQSDEPPAGVFLGDLQYARDVRDGVVVDPVYLPVLYEFPRAMIEAKDYLKPENFRVVNPNLGYSVDNAYLVRELRQAQEKGEQSLRDFLAKHLNVEIGMNLRSDRWAGADFWAQNADKAVSLDHILENCEVVTVGIDGGGLDDLLGLTVLGRMSDGKWLTWSHAWAHPSVLERRKEIAPRLQDFAKDGDLTMVSRVGDDLVDVVAICEQVYDSEKLDKIGIDPGGIGSILDSLQDTDIPHDQIVGVAQNYRLSGAIQTTERKLAGEVLASAPSNMMNWCVSNAKVEIRGKNVYITKQAAGTAKIDPLMSLFNAAYLMAENPEAKGGIDDWLSDPIRTGKA
jgi:phage terminase large subunit-like protein